MTREEAICGLEDMLMSKLDARNNLEVFEEEIPVMLVQDIEALKLAIEALQERPKGRWVIGSELDDVDYEHFLYCSNCHEEAYWDTDYGQQTFDFCPNCGADCRESEE